MQRWSARAAAGCAAIVNFAAESHVDRSILDGADFLRTNVVGTNVLLEAARAEGSRMLQVSTDEVYGDIPPGVSSGEGDPLQPSSPYSAAKASGELFVLAHVRTHGVDALITRGSNTYGPRQYPEKILPLFVTNALDGEPLPLYGDGKQVRDWLHVEDHCAGIELALREGRPGEVYNLGGGEEVENLTITRRVLELTGAPDSLVRPVEDRPGHDRRYSWTAQRRRRSAGAEPGRWRRACPQPSSGTGKPWLVGADQAFRRLPRLLRPPVHLPPDAVAARGVAAAPPCAVATVSAWCDEPSHSPCSPSSRSPASPRDGFSARGSTLTCPVGPGAACLGATLGSKVPPTVATPTTTTVSTTTASTPSVTTATVTTSGGLRPGPGCNAATNAVSAAATGTTVTTGAAASMSASTLVLSGHGWGHGMGMSQWGAYGYALHGWSDTEILLHYYPGTTIGNDPPSTIRVLLGAARPRVRLGSQTAWRLVDRDGLTLPVAAGEITLGAALVFHGHELVSPVQVEPGTGPVEVGKVAYRGDLLVVSNGTSLQVINRVGMEQYLDGVVGAEMPSSWPAAALQAQAIAARSYALAQIEDVVSANPYDLYGDTRSQAYGGIAAETPAVSAAVAATAHQVVLYDGAVATTYYSASSGGETVSAAEALGKPLPYLVSVPDPYDTLSPFHDWGPVSIGATAAGKALGLAGPLLSLQTTSGPSLHVTTVTAAGAGGEVTLAGSAVEADLGLRSTWFDVAWLSLSAPLPPLLPGRAVLLNGTASGMPSVWLQAKTGSAPWQSLMQIAPAPDGSFSAQVSPQQTTRYRLLDGAAAGAELDARRFPGAERDRFGNGGFGRDEPGRTG